MRPPHVVKGALLGWGVLGMFLSPGSPQLTLATQLLFLDITGPNDAIAPWTLSIFDRDGALIESHTGLIPVGIAFSRMGAPGIASFIFQPDVLLQGLDNIRYETPVVPEPADDPAGGLRACRGCLAPPAACWCSSPRLTSRSIVE